VPAVIHLPSATLSKGGFSARRDAAWPLSHRLRVTSASPPVSTALWDPKHHARWAGATLPGHSDQGSL